MHDSVHFVFYEQALDESGGGSGFYVGSVDQSAIDLFTPLTPHEGTWAVAFAGPHFSPVDDLMVYIPNGISGDSFVLSNTRGGARKILFEVSQVSNHAVRWSPDGELITISLNNFDGTNEQFVFSKSGERVIVEE
jgi:hypothetical protein